jgi:hypothetical protein
VKKLSNKVIVEIVYSGLDTPSAAVGYTFDLTWVEDGIFYGCLGSEVNAFPICNILRITERPECKGGEEVE